MTSSPSRQPRLGTAADAAPYIDLARRLELGEVDSATFARELRSTWAAQETLLPKVIFDAIVALLEASDPRRGVGDDLIEAARELVAQHAELADRLRTGTHSGAAWIMPDGELLTDFSAVPQGTSVQLLPYLDVVHSFAAGSIGANDFQRAYLDLHREERWFAPSGMFPVMQEIFYAIEDYVELDHLRDPGELDADQLRARIAELEPELIARVDDVRRWEAEAVAPPP